MGVEDGMSLSSGDESEIDRSQDLELPEKKRKPGIVYLSSVPEGMNVSGTTAFFAEFGRVGRVFLQPDIKTGMRHFTEGWIEFLSKKIARRVAEQINNTPVGGKRKNKAHGTLWNIKYLPRFKWVHLSERLAYEKAVKHQRMRTEISQVKREAEQFKGSVRQKKRKRERSPSSPGSPGSPGSTKPQDHPFLFNQEPTSDQIKKRKLEDQDVLKAKKTKKEKKKKDKEETPRLLSPSISAKSKKGGKKKKKKSSDKKKDGEGSSGSTPLKSAAHKEAASVHKEAAAVHKEAARRKSVEKGKKIDGGNRRKSSEGDRAAFLKSVFGGGT